MPTVKMERGGGRETRTQRCVDTDSLRWREWGWRRQIQIRTSWLESQEKGSAAVWSLGQARSPKEKTRPEDKGTCLTAKFNP